MRLLQFFLVASGITAGLYLYFAFVHPSTSVPAHPFFDGARTLAIAHQGGRGLWPENTLYGFERALDMGVDVLEMDLRETKDGQIVVMHDAAVDRTTEGSGLVRDKNLEEILALDAGYRFEDQYGNFPFRGRGLTVPTLDEVLRRFGETRLNLEMKDFTDESARGFCGEIRRRGLEDRVLVASFGHEPMLAFRERCPEVATSATLREGLLFYELNRVHLGSLYRSPAVAFEVPEYYGDLHVVQPSFLALARRSNLRVQVWTVNEEDDLSRMLAIGVDGVVTDFPDRLLRLMGRLARRP
jgi:glycerophosphoryl diester phosphodiesterase